MIYIEWEEPPAVMQGKTACDRPLWLGPSPDPVHGRRFSAGATLPSFTDDIHCICIDYITQVYPRYFSNITNMQLQLFINVFICYFNSPAASSV